jgi:DNA-binding GntR family transcriptional regulator
MKIKIYYAVPEIQREVRLRVKSVSAKEKVINSLRNDIIEGRFKQGEQLIESSLCKKFSVSNTPLREAIRGLEMEGLVTSIPNRGSFVVEFGDKDINEIYDIRALLEGEATQLAVPYLAGLDFEKLEFIQMQLKKEFQSKNIDAFERHNIEFHKCFHDKCPNGRLISYINQLNKYTRMMRLKALTVPGRPEDIIKEHHEILINARKGNKRKVEELTKKHFENAKAILIASQSN